MTKRTRFLKRTVVVLSVVLVMLMSVAGTLAYLQDKTPPVTNTFTSSDISITLTETATEFKMVPGHTIAKDPKITVDSGSEACYVFVEVAATNGVKLANQTIDPVADYITYAIATGWTKLENVDNVYYRVVKTEDMGKAMSVLAGDQVTVLSTVTKEMMKTIKDDANKAPTLTFTAYAIQLDKNNTTPFTPAEAWAQVNNAG